MSEIYCYLPVYATAKFSIRKPANWNEMSDIEQKDYFLTNMESSSLSLCHQCSNRIETDFDVVESFLKPAMLDLMEGD